MRGPIFGVTFAGVLLTLLMISTLFLAFNVRPVRSSPATIIVPDDYSTIQAAIDNAFAGDTIFVRAGTYDCNIQVDKPLILKGESNQNTTLRLQAGWWWHNQYGLHVIASNVTISGFHLTGDYVMLIAVDGRISPADNCVIKDNVLEEYGTDALSLISSHGDEVVGNVISTQDKSCMYMYSSSNCLLENNTLSGSPCFGIALAFSPNNTVSKNLITNQTDSLGVQAGAITLESFSDDNIVTGNTIVNNDYGVSCWGYTQNNIVYHNNFVNNTHQAYDQLDTPSAPANFWDNGYPIGGNYWSDYNGTDSNSDGIGDTPYVIDANNTDYYPLMNPWTPSPFITATLDVEPHTLNLGSKSEWVTAYIELQVGYSVGDIDVSTVRLNETNPAGFSAIGDYDNDTIPDLMAEFNRTAVSELIQSEGLMTGNVTLTVTGNLTNGTPFQGSAVITVRMPEDVNSDGVVDGGDIAIVAKALGSYGFDCLFPGSPPHPRWNPDSDINYDNVVDGSDLTLVARHFGEVGP